MASKSIRNTVLAFVFIAVLSSSACAEENLRFFWVYRPLEPHINNEVSWLAKQLYGTERINVYGYDNKPIGGVGTLAGWLNHVNETLWDKPTVKVYLKDRNVLVRVFEADDKKTQLKEELEEDRLRVETLSFSGKIRFALVKLLANKL